MVVRFLAKEEVEGSNPFSRSKNVLATVKLVAHFCFLAKVET